MREFIINENDAGQRIDKFIAKLMPRLPKSMLYKGLRKNCVKLNGRHIRDGAVFIDEADILRLYFKDEFFEPEKEFRYIKPDLDIVYEDENIIVINKAVGIVVHSDGQNTGNTLVDMVQSYLFENNEYDPETENTFKPALCNRLDRNTGGLLIAAKNAKALREMNEKLRSREVRKFYMAVVEGYPEKEGHLEGYTSRKNNVTTVSERFSADSKAVSLDYRVLAEKNGYSLVEIELHTGRTHQIRSQFSAAGYPLAGDTKYGGHGSMFRQSLWSIRIQFAFRDTDCGIGYLNGKVIEVEAPFEKNFTK
ncbi:MAG: RluA family pseudouridine synthase [Oscillospiraceae bacterium]|nr:RluA family pseudouridine synthase [Oscillospiraceae bacterium]